MDNQLPLQERIIGKIIEAERLSALIDDLKKAETAMVALGFLPSWHQAAEDAVYLCRLAVITLPRAELDNLIDRVNARAEEGYNLWEQYVLGEWFDNWYGFDTLEEGDGEANSE